MTVQINTSFFGSTAVITTCYYQALTPPPPPPHTHTHTHAHTPIHLYTDRVLWRGKNMKYCFRYALEQPSEVYYGGASYTISAPLSKLPLFVQSGSVIVSQKPEMTLTAARKNALTMEIFMPVEENEG